MLHGPSALLETPLIASAALRDRPVQPGFAARPISSTNPEHRRSMARLAHRWGLRLRWRKDRARLAVVACEPRQEQAGQEETNREDCGRARQEVGRAAARHEASTAAHAQAAAF